MAESWSGLRDTANSVPLHGRASAASLVAVGLFTLSRYNIHMHVHGGGSEKTKRILRISLLATLAYVGLTFFAGVRAHSLALISEAGHNVSDFLALLLSFVAVYFQTRPPTDQKTFGYQRAGVLAAFLNALTLVLIAIWIAIAAVHRLSEPVQVQPRLMMIVAAAGVLMNGVIAALLWTTSRDVNIRSTFIHMLGDTLSTAAVIVGGFAICSPGTTGLIRCFPSSSPR